MTKEHNYNVYAIARDIMEDVKQFVEEQVESDGKKQFLDMSDKYQEDAIYGIREIVDGHEYVIYYSHAWKLCAENNTEEGETYLEETGGINLDKGIDGLICLLSYATILCEVQDQFEDWFAEYEQKIQEELEQAEEAE
jgi:hypothetical protein